MKSIVSWSDVSDERVMSREDGERGRSVVVVVEEGGASASSACISSISHVIISLLQPIPIQMFAFQFLALSNFGRAETRERAFVPTTGDVEATTTMNSMDPSIQHSSHDHPIPDMRLELA